jgi:PKD repeat protein
VSHTWTSAGAYTVTVTAQSQNGVISSPRYYGVAINNPQPVYHQLTIYAFNEFQGNEYPNVYLDNNYIGTAPLSVQVTEGYHTVAVEDPVWDQFWFAYGGFQYMVDQNNNYYGSFASVPIYSDTTLYVYYLL